MKKIGLFTLSITLLCSPAVAQVVPDGGTATTVTTGADGVVNVSVAASNSDGISHNTYTHFNVPRAGLGLDNRLSAARTIVNEVTSTNISRLEGNIRVLGTRAHVIVANPNGILVDGARFINTGNVALTTGDVSFVTRTISGGATPVTQVNTVVTTSKGKITIGPGGLSGTMNSLDLIAKEIEVNGEVRVDNDSPLAKIELHQGDTEFEFDSAVATNNLTNVWNTLNAAGGTAQDQLTVDITRGGSLRANSISIIVNDQGAGFRHAGDIVAGMDNFELSSTGLVELNDGHITATAHAIVDAKEVALTGTTRQAQIKADNGGLLIKTSAGLSNVGGLLEGNQRIAGNADSLGGLTLNVGGDILNRSTSSNILGVMFSEADDLSITSAGSMRNESARLFSNQAATLNITGDFTNTTPIADFTGRGELEHYTRKGHRTWYSLFTLRRKTRGLRIDYGVADIEGQDGILLADGDITINAKNIYNRGGVINATNSGSINTSSELFVNERFLTGKAQQEITCAWFCDRNAFSTVRDHGGRVQAGAGITINATSSIESIGGEFLANGDMGFTSPKISARAIDTYSAIQRSQGLRGFFRLDDAKIIRADQGGSFVSNMGKINFDTFSPITIDGGFIQAAQGVDSGNQRIEIISEPTKDSPYLRTHLGLFGGLL